MKRASIIFAILLAAFVILSQNGAEAVTPTFAERFSRDTKMGDSGAYG